MTLSRTISAGLIGHGIGGSLTPAMHEAEGRANGLDYSYYKIDTALPANRGKSLEVLLTEAEARGFAGVNITHPFKVQVLQLLDSLSAGAELVGAANTVQFRDGKRIGHNTDITGFETAFRAGLGDVRLDHVLLLGAGGAGAAVAHVLLTLGVGDLAIFSKEIEQSEALARALSGQHPDPRVSAIAALENLDLQGLDGVVNATPMGMNGHPGMAIPGEMLRPRMWVADIVYFPLKTELLRYAEGLGCRTMSGAGMAIHQAADAFELITGLRADPSRMAACFEAMTARTENLSKERSE